MFEDVLTCCKDGNLERLKDVVENQKCDVTQDRHNALRIASSNGHLHILKYLVEEQKCNVHIDDGWLLVLAAEYSHNHIIHYLVENHCGLKHIKYCIEMSIQNNNLDAVKYFLSLTKSDIDISFALVTAIEDGHVEIVRYLMDYKKMVNVNFNSKFLYTASNGHLVNVNFNLKFCYTASNGHLQMVKYLASHCDVDVHYKDEYALRFASLFGHFDIAQYLIKEHHSDVRALSDTALLWATENSHLEVMKLLIENGAPSSLPSVKRHKRFQKYILFCKKNILKRQLEAQKKIYFWWIPICYSLEHPSGCGQRMMEKNWTKYTQI